MALIASLQFGDNDNRIYSKEYLVSDVRCHISRSYNKHYADGRALCERLEFTVIAPGKEDLTLFDWYISRSTMSGRIVITMSNETNFGVDDHKEILFEDATCFRLAENYNIDAGRRTMTLSINTRLVTIDNIDFKTETNLHG